MFYDNNATRIKRQLLIEIVKLYYAGELESKINRLPIELYPRDNEPYRCCVYKDRAIVGFRLMAQLGMKVEDDDELTPLSEYARRALERDTVETPILTVMQEACRSCVKVNYMVTNACQGCVARPCTIVCPKNAISMSGGKSQIDSAKCVSCGLCKQACPYHAIIYLPVPCEEACPVDAIYRDDNGKENIDFDKCIFCGKCMRECPFGAIMERSQIVDVMRKLTGAGKVVALVAPSIVGQFPGSLEMIVAAVRKAGFDKVMEVAGGAYDTAVHEAAEFVERVGNGDTLMTTSCCPAYTLAVGRHVPEMKPYVSHTPTPLNFTAKAAKAADPEAVTVFVGPCVAKREEALHTPEVDFVLTFEELGALLVGKGIDVAEMPADPLAEPADRLGRVFAVSSGVTTAVAELVAGRLPMKPVAINGLTSAEIKLLRAYANGKMQGNFLEVMSCEGGCIAGPGVLSNPKLAARKVEELTKKK